MGDSESVATSGFQVICPEENAQLGSTFFSSDEAFKASSFHNSTTGHNSTVVPCTNC